MFIIIFYCDYRFFSVSPILSYYDALVLSLEVALKAGDRSSGALGTDIFIYRTNVASLLSVAAISPQGRNWLATESTVSKILFDSTIFLSY